MFLLIRKPVCRFLLPAHFTFHDVSINTYRLYAHISDHPALHSTMFLLIRNCLTSAYASLYNFTFHDVSINTDTQNSFPQTHLPLHSTMFLLILIFTHRTLSFLFFTFHDVSINTRCLFILTIQI